MRKPGAPPEKRVGSAVKVLADLAEHQRRDRELAAESGARRAIAATAITSAQKISTPGERRTRAFSTYLRTGKIGPDLEQRDSGEATGPAGGFLVPPAFGDAVLTALRFVSPLIDNATIWESDTGAPGNYPVLDDVAQSAGTYTENDLLAEAAESLFKQVAFGICPTWTAPGLWKGSRALVQDSRFPIEDLLATAFAARLARATEADWIAKLLASTMTTTTTVGAGVVTYAELVNAAYGLDMSYRSASTSFWLAHRTTVAQLRVMVDTANRPLLVDADGVQFTADGSRLSVPSLFGRPVYESSSMPAFAAGAKVLMLADWRRALVVRIAERPSVVRLEERYADSGAIGFVGYARFDGQVGIPAAGCIVQLHA